jgi:hypothetical protein
MGILISGVLDLEMPSEFPTRAYDSALNRLTVGGLSSLTAEHCRAGWLGVGFRYLAVVEGDERFAESLREHGSAPPMPERVDQEHALFQFSAAACSVIECFAYSVHSAAAGLGVPGFRVSAESDRRGVNRTTTATRLETDLPNHVLPKTLVAVLGSTQWEALTITRNVLLHRAAPPRQVFLTNVPGVDRPSEIRQSVHRGADLVVTPQLTSDRRAWLATSLHGLCDALMSWLDAKGVPPDPTLSPGSRLVTP